MTPAENLEALLAELDSEGGGITLRPSGAEVFLPAGTAWAKKSYKRRASEGYTELAQRSIERALLSRPAPHAAIAPKEVATT